jgi:hypothetical protein
MESEYCRYAQNQADKDPNSKIYQQEWDKIEEYKQNVLEKRSARFTKAQEDREDWAGKLNWFYIKCSECVKPFEECFPSVDCEKEQKPKCKKHCNESLKVYQKWKEQQDIAYEYEYRVFMYKNRLREMDQNGEMSK